VLLEVWLEVLLELEGEVGVESLLIYLVVVLGVTLVLLQLQLLLLY
jgi:hypothetical protein